MSLRAVDSGAGCKLVHSDGEYEGRMANRVPRAQMEALEQLKQELVALEPPVDEAGSAAATTQATRASAAKALPTTDASVPELPPAAEEVAAAKAEAKPSQPAKITDPFEEARSQ